jgi:hypothetical protein
LVLGAISALLCGAVAQAQPVITSISPDGSHLFQPASVLSFHATSTVGVTNVTVALTVTSLSGSSFLKNLTQASGLTVNGATSKDLTVTANLTSNVMYAAVIQATDANGVSSSASVSFDTINPSYTFEAEDFDYNGGSFIDNPQTNQYAGLAAVNGVDCQHDSTQGGASYRPNPLSTEGCGDVARTLFIGAGNTNKDFDVGFNNGTDWANYTRHFPPGLYNIYLRGADGNGDTADCASMTVASAASGQTALLGTGPFTFSVKSTGWQTYRFYPLLDANKSLVQFTNDGSQTTMRVTVDGGNFNANFYMLVPANTNIETASVSFTNVYPDGSVQFQPTNSFALTINSAAGVDPSQVFVQLTATNLIGIGSVKVYTTANGLTVTGPSTSLQASVPLASNTVYSAFIQAIDLNGNPNSATFNFDTVVPLYTFDAEDYDYNDGQYFDNPQINAYLGAAGDPGVDYSVDDPFSGSHAYRDNDPNTGGPATESCGDVPRAGYTNAAVTGVTDYDVGFNDPANWENYTRHYPNGTFNIFMRGANGGGGDGSANLALVTSGAGTHSQVVSNLGTFTVHSTGNWQKYEFCPLKDNSGNLVKLTFSGSAAETLRVVGPSSVNGNYYLLEPANNSLPTVVGLYPDGTAFFQQTNTLSFTASSSDGIATSNIVITINGQAASGVVFTGSSTSWGVKYSGLLPNHLYNVSISVRTLTGNSFSKAFTFDTYSPNNYQWESSDYDYTSNGVSGLYIDNPQINAYNGLIATPGIDEQEVTSGTPINEDLYRPTPDGSTVLIPTQGGGDLARAQFGSNPTWRINWFGFGDFANYTRHYPAGKYNVLARFTEGGSASSATLYKVTSGVGTPTQTTSLLGTFNIPANGWNGWEWCTLVDNSSNAVTVTLDGSATTLQLAGPVADDSQTINVGFFMLVPVGPAHPTLSATANGGQITISFLTATGANYQVVASPSLTAPNWQPVGSLIPGNNAVQSAHFSTTGGQMFYQVQVK